MAVNNELGAINDLKAIGDITKSKNVLFHVDAAQGYGKIDLDINEMNIDLLSVSGHKIYGPKGVGFLYVRSKRPRVKLSKHTHGGDQEFGLRAGTLANHQIFALSEACECMFNVKKNNYSHVLQLRNIFLDEMKTVACMNINTPLEQSYPGILSVTFKNIKSETLLAMLDGACMSVGSACNSRAVETSHVLSAIGLSQNQSDSTIRISFGLMTTKNDIQEVTKNMKSKVEILESISPHIGAYNA
jgi:cysteine desulfurase